MVRFTDYCVNNNLPIIERMEPLELREIRGIKRRIKEEIYEVEGESAMMEDIQIARSTMAVVANAESRFEIKNNVFTIPMATKSKFFPSFYLIQ